MNGGSTGTQRSSRTNRRTWREGAVQCLVKIQSILMICVVTLCKGERGVEGPRGLAGLDGIPVLLCQFNVYLVDGPCVLLVQGAAGPIGPVGSRGPLGVKVGY